MNKIALLLSFLLGILIGSMARRPEYKSTVPEIILRHDTVKIPEPVAVSIRTVDTVFITVPMEKDTVQVPLPIEQKMYSSPEYTVWVSGYVPALDSLHLNIPVTERNQYRPAPQRRFSAGIQAGYGITPRGLQPYIGIGVSYRLL